MAVSEKLNTYRRNATVANGWEDAGRIRFEIEPDAVHRFNVGMGSFVRRMLRVPERVDTRFYLQFLFFKHVLRINRDAPWPIHFTSKLAAPERIKAGRCSYPGDMPGCYIQAINGIEIGDHSIFAPGVGLISANHDPEHLERHIACNPIRIGSHCWFGMNSIVLPGVQLGDRTIVGAGSVVTHSFPEGYCIIAGNPARLIRKLPPTSG